MKFILSERDMQGGWKKLIQQHYAETDGVTPRSTDLSYFDIMPRFDIGGYVTNSDEAEIYEADVSDMMAENNSVLYVMRSGSSNVEPMMVVNTPVEENGQTKMTPTLLTGKDLSDWCEKWAEDHPHMDSAPEPVARPGFFARLLHGVFGYKTQSYQAYENYEKQSNDYAMQETLEQVKPMAEASHQRQTLRKEQEARHEMLEKGDILLTGRFLREAELRKAEAAMENMSPAEKKQALKATAEAEKARGNMIQQIIDGSDALQKVQANADKIVGSYSEADRAVLELDINDQLLQLDKKTLASVPGISAEELLDYVCKRYEKAHAKEETAAMRAASKEQSRQDHTITAEEYASIDPRDQKNWEKQGDGYVDAIWKFARTHPRVKEGEHVSLPIEGDELSFHTAQQKKIVENRKAAQAAQEKQQAEKEQALDQAAAKGQDFLAEKRSAAYETLGKKGVTGEEISDAMATIIACHSAMDRSDEVAWRMADLQGVETKDGNLTPLLQEQKQQRRDLRAKLAEDPTVFEKWRASVKKDPGFREMSREMQVTDSEGASHTTTEFKRCSAMMCYDHMMADFQKHDSNLQVKSMMREADMIKAMKQKGLEATAATQKQDAPQVGSAQKQAGAPAMKA